MCKIAENYVQKMWKRLGSVQETGSNQCRFGLIFVWLPIFATPNTGKKTAFPWRKPFPSWKITPNRFIDSALSGAIHPNLLENCYRIIGRFGHVFWLDNAPNRLGRNRSPRHRKSGKAGRYWSTYGGIPYTSSRVSSPPARPTKWCFDPAAPVRPWWVSRCGNLSLDIVSLFP